MQNSKRKIIVLLLSLLVLFGVGWWVKASLIDKPTLINVTGEGKVKAKPEMVSFTVSLVNSASSSTLALADNARLVRDVIAIAKLAGASEKDMVVSYVQMVTPNSVLGQTNYQAINAVRITLKNLNRFDNLVNQLYAKGVRGVTNIVFTTENAKDLEKQAVSQAVVDAQKRAKEMAKSLKKRVARMVSVATTETGVAGAGAGEAPSQNGFKGVITSSPSQIEIVRHASIVFELK